MSPRTRWRTQSSPGCSGWSIGQADRAGDLAQVLGVHVGGHPAAAQPGPDPGPAEVVGRVGAGQRAAQLEPAHLDRRVTGEEHAVVQRDDVDVVEHRHRQGEAAQLERVRSAHASNLPRSSAEPLARQGETHSRRVIMRTPGDGQPSSTRRRRVRGRKAAPDRRRRRGRPGWRSRSGAATGSRSRCRSPARRAAPSAPAICSSSRLRQDRESRAQSALVGVRPSGRVARAAATSSRDRPMLRAARTNASRRRTLRW